MTVDHPDPSIFTVLTAPSAEPGVAVVDFVIFPPRWMCAEHTFRPPYYHRNVMSEFMGLVGGSYDAKAGGEEGLLSSLLHLPNRECPSADRAVHQSTYCHTAPRDHCPPPEGEEGFVPGGSSLHGVSTPHGPDAASFAKAIAADTSKPVKFDGGLAFMFETSALLRLSNFAADPAHGLVQEKYYKCWEGLPRSFRRPSTNGADGAPAKKPRQS